MTSRDFSLPQPCPSRTSPHLPNSCGDPLHAILAMSDVLTAINGGASAAFTPLPECH